LIGSCLRTRKVESLQVSHCLILRTDDFILPVQRAHRKIYIEHLYNRAKPQYFFYFFQIAASKPELVLAAHEGFVCVLQRSPFFKDILLSIGGWTFAIWKEGVSVNLFFCIVGWFNIRKNVSRSIFYLNYYNDVPFT
jgi:hypothetical protein